MCQDDSLFYLSTNHKYKPESYWFKKVPLGIHMIDGMMKKMAKDGNLTGKKKTIIPPGRHRFRHCVPLVFQTQQ